ncbi:ABC transporter substrate-binding protein [Occultella kanbiaonis]|uniref:ABC transporter substrate-binding protein n=1 Tax=Occultella kanbiaonis TaxID=2675754 RepID=UPI0013D05745|nr:ABC transporter substrate-binding protein [Occultella kanbiaonis]
MTIYTRDVSRRSLLVYGGGGALITALGLTACTAEEESPDPFGGGGTDAMESPMLTELVDAGELPELAERLPTNPKVLEPLDGPGQFGGTLRYAQTDVNATAVLQSFANQSLLEWGWDANTPEESVAESWEVNEDNTVYTLTLREGLKWSDGEPFTTADVLFSMVDWLGNSTLMPAVPFWFANLDGTPLTAEAEDELTLTVTCNEPFALLPKYFCHPAVGYQFLKPRHYLEQFHGGLTDEATVLAEAQEAGFDSWDQLFADRDNLWTNPDRPTMGAYQVVEAANAQSGVGRLSRNPYFWKTDPDGRQLPYIDEMQIQVLQQDTMELRAANGDLDFLGNGLGYKAAQVLQQNAETNGYRMLRWRTSNDGLLAMCPNLSHQDEVLREIFLNRDFRTALSHAIDRDDINNTLMDGLGPIRQPNPTEGTDYYVEGGQNYLEYDVDKANELLDGIGLTLGSDGIRLRPDGAPLQVTAIFVEATDGVPRADALGMIQAAWAAVGIDLLIRPVDGTLASELRNGNDFDFDCTPHPSNDWDLEPVWFIPTSSGSHTAPGYGLWYNTGGTEGIEPPEEFQTLMDNWDALRSAATDEERIAAGQAIATQHDEEAYVIGIVGVPFQPVVVGVDVHNVRDDEPSLDFYHGREGVTKPAQVYFAEAAS